MLVVEVDGSMLPIRGDEPWKEAKVGVTYRHDQAANEPIAGTSRYVAIVNGMGEFAPVLEEALAVEDVDDVGKVVWLGDGAVCNWNLADQLCPDAVQLLEWHRAMEHAVDCGKVLLGDESQLLPPWQRRAEDLLAAGDSEVPLSEVMDRLEMVEPKPPDTRERLQASEDLVRYYRATFNRVKYRLYREDRVPSAAARSRAPTAACSRPA